MEKSPVKKKKKQKLPLWVPIIRTATVLVTLAVLLYTGNLLVKQYIYINGLKPVLLTGETVDLREATLSIGEYEALAQQHPGQTLLWNVPIGGVSFDCASEHIILEKLDVSEIPYFSYFHSLKTVNAEKCPDHKALTELQKAYPELQISWKIHLGGKSWDRDGENVDLRRSNVTVQELTEALPYFAPGTRIHLDEKTLTDAERDMLKQSFPELHVLWGVELMGETWSSGETKLSFAGKKVDVEALTAAAPEFERVEEVDLSGCGCSLEELMAIQQAFSGALIRSELELYEVELTTDVEEFDLSGISIKDTTALEQAVTLMPNLKKVIMCDCGLNNEEMDALNKRHEGIQFVWIVRFSVYSLRTDATVFCASDLPSRGYIAIKMDNKMLDPLKYCTELVALDLGHMRYTDLSFLKDMHKLKYLILVEARYRDISVIAQMPELYYLELFNNTINDISPLLECKSLRHLNIGYTKGFDPSPLKQMTWLERLWFPGHRQTEEVKQEIIAALPDTQVYMPAWDADGSTGGGWRETEEYYEMRDVFDMHYQPGGTGTDKDKKK